MFLFQLFSDQRHLKATVQPSVCVCVCVCVGFSWTIHTPRGVSYPALWARRLVYSHVNHRRRKDLDAALPPASEARRRSSQMKMKLIGNLSACDTDMQQPQAQRAEMESLTTLLLHYPAIVLSHLKREQINLFGTLCHAEGTERQSLQWRGFKRISCNKRLFVWFYSKLLEHDIKVEALPLQGHATECFLTITSHNLIFYDFLAVINRVKRSQLCEPKTKN